MAMAQKGPPERPKKGANPAVIAAFMADSAVLNLASGWPNIAIVHLAHCVVLEKTSMHRPALEPGLAQRHCLVCIQPHAHCSLAFAVGSNAMLGTLDSHEL